MEAYKEFVRRNRLWLSSIESMANTMTWFLPERFAKSELAPEAFSTVVGLVTVMNEHIIATTPVVTGSQSSPPPHDPSFPWPLLVSVVKEVEVLVEMGAEYYLGKEYKWTPVATVEALKAIMRLLVLHKSGYRMLIDGGETLNADEKPGPSHCDPVARPQRLGASSSSSNQPRAIQAMNKYRNNVGVRPSWLGTKPVARAPPLPSQTYDARSLQQANKVKVLGEVLLILRPFLYVMMIRRYGLRSWRPWLSALALDATGMAVLYGANALPGRNTRPMVDLSKQEKNELLRRQVLWALYLMRSPFFNRYTQRRLEGVENILKPVPLFGSLAGKAVELILGVQAFYTYTAAS